MATRKNKLDTVKKATGKKASSPKKPATRKKAKVTTEKASQLDNLNYADGKEEENIRKARELEELVGLDQVNPYGTSITSVFEESLSGMTLVDMQELAVSVGVFPSGTKTGLKNKLLKSFRDHQRGSSSFVVPSSSSICEGADRESEAFKKALKLMKEGL
tara:strand:+ start:282 stop:761 length:480 start_codon:yes stop_codon:yes gene_type:complete